MISLNNLSVNFSGGNLFDNISFIVNDKDRIGLVGKNGSGKTTLLRIVKGIIEPDKGNVVIPSNSSVGYLPQEMIINSTKSIFDEALDAFSDIIELEKKINNLTVEISNRTDHHTKEYLDIINKYNEANTLFNIHGGNSIIADTEKILKGLGFPSKEFQRPVKEFSSGWQMRVELAKILLQKPDIILLDEPTNHLDIESIQWLEDYLINYNGAVVLVSHDRAFLDNITQRTIEISMGKIYDYKANYSYYVTLREERLEQQLATFNNQQKEIKDIESFIERFRYKATKSRQVQSRIKKLNKMELIEVDEFDKSEIHFRFPPAPNSGNVVLEAKHLEKKYEEKLILHDLNFNILKTERIAFVGRNGEGKTTLTKIINRQTDYEGELKMGHNVSIGYYAQTQADLLNPEKTIFETIDDIAVGDIRKSIRTILGSFLFSGDSIDKKVKVLSGGEKARLALTKLLLTPVNLLILDEPTNHLDMVSKDILKNALLKYDGTLILVSHDRDFLQGLTDRIFEFKDHGIKEFIGDIYEFLDSRKMSSLNEFHTSSKKNQQTKFDKKSLVFIEEKEKRKSEERNLKMLNKKIQNSETEIANIEKELKELDVKLKDPEFYKNFSNSNSEIVRYDFLNKKLIIEMNNWEKLCNDLNKTKA